MALFDTIRAGASGAAEDFTVERSLRFNDGDSPKLNRTFGTNSSNTTKTLSFWMKRGNSGSYQTIFGTTNSGYIEGRLQFTNTDQLQFVDRDANDGLGDAEKLTTRKFRDAGAWYHIVLALNSTDSTADDRVKIYVNGVRETSFSASTNPSSSYSFSFYRSSAGNFIGANDSSDFFDGYLAEINFVDGQALDQSSFGETDADTGQWNPIDTSGLTFGTNGFRLKFADNSGTSATTLGKDTSGNSNNFTPNNFGTGDAVKDSPTNNFCTFIGILPTAQTTFAEGNLKMTVVDSHKTVYGTHGLRSGKWYWEARAISVSSTKWTYGVSDIENSTNTQTTNNNMLLAVEPAANYAYGDAVSIYNTNLYKNGSVVTSSYQTATSGGDIIGIALDVDTGKVWFARNGTWINGSATASTTLNESSHDTTVATGKVYTPAYSAEGVGWQANFGQDSSFSNAATAQGNTDGGGQGDFYYAVPSGFKAICSTNLPDPTILLPNQYFETLIWTGNSVDNRDITGLSFQPDWVWIKQRSGTEWNNLVDAVRGSTKYLFSNETNSETTSSNRVQAFNSDGFELGTDSSVNSDTQPYVSWNWNAGGTTVTNNDGAISSQVRTNSTAGFSIVTYTGDGGNPSTVGHGLGVAADVLIVKNRSNSANWGVFHHKNTSAPETEIIYLNSNGGTNDRAVFNDTMPTSTVFSVKAFDEVNNINQTYVAYCFSEVSSYSKFGSYVGNDNADGTFVYTGFRPAWILIKKTSSSVDWILFDTKRYDSNRAHGSSAYLFPNLNAAEDTTENIDILSNGFKLRAASGYFNNPSGGTFIYLAFAESPFKNARAR